MNVSQPLIDDHQIIRIILNCLEKAAEQLDNNRKIRPGIFTEILNFNKEFIENIHQKAEEKILFDVMIEHGLSIKDPSMTMVILEHEQSRLYVRRMRSAVDRWQTGSKTAHRDVVRNAFGFIELLRQHMQDEDDKLYPLAEKIIPPEAQQKVLDAIDAHYHKFAGQMTRERYSKFAEALVKEIDGKQSEVS